MLREEHFVVISRHFNSKDILQAVCWERKMSEDLLNRRSGIGVGHCAKETWVREEEGKIKTIKKKMFNSAWRDKGHVCVFCYLFLSSLSFVHVS